MNILVVIRMSNVNELIVVFEHFRRQFVSGEEVEVLALPLPSSYLHLLPPYELNVQAIKVSKGTIQGRRAAFCPPT